MAKQRTLIEKVESLFNLASEKEEKMKVTYSERSLYCDWYEQKTVENVKTIEPLKKGLFLMTFESGEQKTVYANCIIKIDQ